MRGKLPKASAVHKAHVTLDHERYLRFRAMPGQNLSLLVNRFLTAYLEVLDGKEFVSFTDVLGNRFALVADDIVAVEAREQ